MVPEFGVLNRVYHPRFQIQKQSSRDVVVVVGLVEKHVFSVPAVAILGELLQNPILRDAVFLAQLLPKLGADLVAALPDLQRDHLSRHFCSVVLSLGSGLRCSGFLT